MPLIAENGMEIYREKCAKCGYSKYKGSLHVHHIDKNKENNNPKNLVVLCANCHWEVHHNFKKLKHIVKRIRYQNDTFEDLLEKMGHLERENGFLRQKLAVFECKPFIDNLLNLEEK